MQEQQQRENLVDVLIKNTFGEEPHEYKQMKTKLAFNLYQITEKDFDESGNLVPVKPEDRQYIQFNLQAKDSNTFLYLVQRDQNCQVTLTEYFINKYIIDVENNKLIPENEGLFYQISQNDNGRNMIITNLYNKITYIKYDKKKQEWVASINFNQYMFASSNGWMLIDYINLPLPKFTCDNIIQKLGQFRQLEQKRQLQYQYNELFKLMKTTGEEGQSVANSYQFLIIGKAIAQEKLNCEQLYNEVLDFIEEYNGQEVNFDRQINKIFFKKNVNQDSPVLKFLAQHAHDLAKYIISEEVYIQPMYYQMFVLSKYQNEQNMKNFDYECNPIQQKVLSGNYKQEHVEYQKPADKPVEKTEKQTEKTKVIVFKAHTKEELQKRNNYHPRSYKNYEKPEKHNEHNEHNEDDIQIEVKHKTNHNNRYNRYNNHYNKRYAKRED